MEIRCDVTEIDRAERHLRGTFFELMSSGARKGVMGEVGATVRDIAQNRIASKKYSPDGEPWRPWSPTYKAPKHGGHSLLRLSGAMMSGIQRGRYGPRKASVGSPAVYANVHQHGHTFTNAFGRGITVHVPARPFLGWGPDERDAAESSFTEWMQEALRWR